MSDFLTDFATLVADPRVVALVGNADAITVGEATRDNWPRYVVMRQIGSTPEVTSDENTVGTGRLDRNLVEVTIYAESRAKAVEIEELVRRIVENDATHRAGLQSALDHPFVLTDHKGRILTFEAWQSIDSLPAI